jgi:hypothetical protein
MSKSPPELGPSMVNITCACGHEADFMEFRTSPVAGELPRHTYQCPKCKKAWKVQCGKPWKGWSGMILPGKTEVIRTTTSL